MNTPLRPVFCFAALALFAAASGAQTMKPGLWEVTNKIGGSPEMDQSMSQMQQQMASMPPSERKIMEDMMAKHGVQMSGTAGGGMVARCASPKRWPNAIRFQCNNKATAPAAPVIKPARA